MRHLKMFLPLPPPLPPHHNLLLLVLVTMNLFDMGLVYCFLILKASCFISKHVGLFFLPVYCLSFKEHIFAAFTLSSTALLS